MKIRRIWTVINASPNSELEDVVAHLTPTELIAFIKGSREPYSDELALYTSKAEALADARSRMKRPVYRHVRPLR